MEYLKLVEEKNSSPEKQDKKKSNPPKSRTNQERQSATDPEATLVKRSNKPLQLAYKQHISVDNGSARIITGCVTTTARIPDESKLPHLISKVYDRHGILPEEVAADTIYGTADTYRFLLENKIKPSIPRLGGHTYTGLWTKDNFIYDDKRDQYICPAGHILSNKGYSKKERKFIYRASRKACKKCAYRSQCTKSPARYLTRHIYEATTERALEHLKTPEAQETIKERKKFVETAFACEKKDLGLSRAKFRGLKNTAIQALLTATAYNLKKIVKYCGGHRNKSPAGIRPLLPRLEAKVFKVRGDCQRNNFLKTFYFVVSQFFRRISFLPYKITLFLHFGNRLLTGL